MSQTWIGTVQQMEINAKNDQGYVLEKAGYNAHLSTSETLTIGDSIDVFLYDKGHELFASIQIPQAQMGIYGWGEVTEIVPRLGLYVNIGTDLEVLVLDNDLPVVRSVWPKETDRLYVHLKKDRKNRLFAVPAKEKDFDDLIKDASNLDLNEQIGGPVIRAGREGSVVYTENGYRGFIHYSEREREPRLGEVITGRIIEVKEDGTINISLMPLKQDRMESDAEKILAYIEANDGVIPFNNKSDPELIKNTFGMSKSAFKRAIGKLYKNKQIDFINDEIFRTK